jgi:hypothetical protein
MVEPALHRIIAVVGGFFLSILSGAFVLFGLSGYYLAFHLNSDGAYSLSQYIDNALTILSAFTAPITLIPAVIIVVAGELAHIRSMLYYIVAGGAAAVVMPLVVTPPDGPSGAYSGAYFSVVATSGFAAGFVYWLVAGRRA